MEQLMLNTNPDDLFDLTDNPDEERNFEIPSYLKKRRKVCGLYEPTECKGDKKKRKKKKKKKNKDHEMDSMKPYYDYGYVTQDLIDATEFDESYVRYSCDIPDCYVVKSNEDSGFFCGNRQYYSEKETFVGKSQKTDGHIIVIGGPGCGKTSATVIPTLNSWKGRIIAFDVKGNGGDLVTPWYTFNQDSNKRLFVFNPTIKNTARYDPFSLLRYDREENMVNHARDLALALIPSPSQSTFSISVDKVWSQMAQNLLTGAILYYFSLGYTFPQMMQTIQYKTIQSLVDEIMGSETDSEESGECRHAAAKMFIGKFKNLKPEIMACVGMEISELVTLAVDPYVIQAFTTDPTCELLQWSDFLTDEHPYDVILQIPEDKLDQWEPLITLMLNQLTKTLERRADKHSSDVCGLQPVLIMLDEFPRLGTCHAIKNGLATLRSRGITIAIFIQNIAQLDERYGMEGRRNILGNCAYKLLLDITEPDDQEYFSRLLGTIPIARRSYSVSLDGQGVTRNSSVTIREEREFIVQPHELGQLGDKAVFITPTGFYWVWKEPYYQKITQTQLPEAVDFIASDVCMTEGSDPYEYH